MVSRYSHQANEDCPIRWRTDLAGCSALPSEILEWPLTVPTTNDQGTQTERNVDETQTQTEGVLCHTTPPKPAPGPSTQTVPRPSPSTMDVDPISSDSEEAEGPFDPLKAPKRPIEKANWWTEEDSSSHQSERYIRPRKRKNWKKPYVRPRETAYSRPPEPTCFLNARGEPVPGPSRGPTPSRERGPEPARGQAPGPEPA
ncbi:translation initiation factor IF-2-like [Leptopilina heterotoma]|uniref:translation initiation factor IF-2-like n=1 Tax=Leptopilina heterotoma TaxID=63436 RepID=UPI001CA85A2A|nr:translation initiation factor IF-2-like [Leptopilina heterotoma]XP_043467396.1 translation initiation factor IF-2-like [Leptopilina heterotoma]